MQHTATDFCCAVSKRHSATQKLSPRHILPHSAAALSAAQVEPFAVTPLDIWDVSMFFGLLESRSLCCWLLAVGRSFVSRKSSSQVTHNKKSDSVTYSSSDRLHSFHSIQSRISVTSFNGCCKLFSLLSGSPSFVLCCRFMIVPCNSLTHIHTHKEKTAINKALSSNVIGALLCIAKFTNNRFSEHWQYCKSCV